MKVKAGVPLNGSRIQIYPTRQSFKRSRPSTSQRSTAAGPLPPIQSESESESVSADSSSYSSSGSEADSAPEQEEETSPVDLTSGSGSGSITAPLSATLTDLNVLDCPICYGSLFSPVYQCENGHISCASCCSRMANKCPNCCRPTGTIRCRALETVLESVNVNCVNMQYGCTETVPYYKRRDHEKKCVYSPCSCPHIDCNYTDMPVPLCAHFTQCHPRSSDVFSFTSKISISLDANRARVYLQDAGRGTLFVLNRMVKSPGSFVSVVCVGPSSWKGSFSYDLTVVIDKDTHVKMKAGVECMPKWTAAAASVKCLVLPSDLVDARGQLKLELIITRNPKSLGEGTTQIC